MRRPLVIPPIVLDRSSREPLREQVRRQMAGAIRDEVLTAGSRLPSSRMLAKLLGVSRNTILTAYDDLASAGVIWGEAGSGVHVAGPRQMPRPFPDLRHVLADSQLPLRSLGIADPDGNPLYLNY